MFAARNMMMAGGFSPLSLSPALWLDASITAAITSSGGAVSSWADQSGNNRHVSQSAAGAKPTTGAATLNGRNVLTFDGGDCLVLGSSSLAASLAGFTIFAVAKASTASGTGYQTVVASEIGGTLVRSVIYIRNGGNEAGGRKADANSYQFTTQGTVSNNTYAVLSAVFDYSGANLYAYSNGAGGARSGGFQTGGASTTSSTNGPIAIGAASNAGLGLTGAIAEVLIFTSALSEANRQSLESYLNSKYALY